MSFRPAFCPSLLERSLPSTGMARKEMEKTCTRWDIRPLIRGTLLSHCVYLSASTKCMLHIDVLENTLRHLDCSWSSEHNDITGPLIWDDIGWFNNEKSSRMYTSHMRRLHRNERLHMLTLQHTVHLYKTVIFKCLNYDLRTFLLPALIRTTKIRLSLHLSFYFSSKSLHLKWWLWRN